MGAAEPTHGHAADPATAGDDGTSAIRSDTPRHAAASAATIAIRDRSTVEDKRELDRSSTSAIQRSKLRFDL